jgi:geranylgeranyl diphosphate synthase type I
MNLAESIHSMLPAIEAELRQVVDRLDAPQTAQFHEMLSYHMGWSGAGAGPDTTGKRVRPLIVLLTTATCGTDWHAALPAAASVELVHNFSLVHDDVQDHSDLRRGRPTVWKIWGIPQAINAGDGLFVLANQALLGLQEVYPHDVILETTAILQKTCLDLTRGQFLDMSFEARQAVASEEYWHMITGKTAALLSACCQIGALLGGADEMTRSAYQEFGHYLGLAFQVKDDYLGIWGDSIVTGKSTISDLVVGKKSLPVLLGLEKNGAFAAEWSKGRVDPSRASQLAEMLAGEGIKLKVQETVDQCTDLALNSLRAATDENQGDNPLYELALSLLARDS